MTPTEIRNRLKPEDREKILDLPYPKPYYHDLNAVRAILLGCDPSNSHSANLPYVFAIMSDIPAFKQFIDQWEKSLKAINLDFKSVYIQNLCQNYFAEETSENKIWNTVTEFWIPALKKELKIFHPKIPVLLSSELLYLALINDKANKIMASDFYNLNSPVPIPAEENKLERPLIPFYRHYRYQIYKLEWSFYRERIQSITDELSA